MIYSATTEYAIRALAHLATLEEGERILARDLAEATNIPRQFLGKILHRMARLDVLDSAKGRGGGFKFARPSDDIKVSDIVEIFEGGDAVKQCVLGLDECNDTQPCPMHDQWVQFRRALTDRVHSVSLTKLGRNLAAKRALHGGAPADLAPDLADEVDVFDEPETEPSPENPSGG